MAVLGARGMSSGEPAQTADHHGMAANENLQTLPAAAAGASPAAIPARLQECGKQSTGCRMSLWWAKFLKILPQLPLESQTINSNILYCHLRR